MRGRGVPCKQTLLGRCHHHADRRADHAERRRARLRRVAQRVGGGDHIGVVARRQPLVRPCVSQTGRGGIAAEDIRHGDAIDHEGGTGHAGGSRHDPGEHALRRRGRHAGNHRAGTDHIDAPRNGGHGIGNGRRRRGGNSQPQPNRQKLAAFQLFQSQDAAAGVAGGASGGLLISAARSGARQPGERSE